MESILEWFSNNPLLAILSALGSIASIWGLYLAFRKQASNQSVRAGRNIRNSAIESTGSANQEVIAGQDIIGSPIKHSPNKNGE